MSKNKGPYLHGRSGTVGGEVFYSQFGQQLSRSEPAKYDDANTIPQQTQRLVRFKPALLFTKQLKAYCKGLYQTQPSKRSAFSDVMSKIITGYSGTLLAPVVNFADVVLGNGDLVEVPLLSATKASVASFNITWDPSLNGPYDSSTDTCSVFVMNDDKSVIYYLVGDIKERNAGSATFVVPGALSGSDIFISSARFVSDTFQLKSVVRLEDPEGIVSLA